MWVEMVWRTLEYHDQLVASIASGEQTSRKILINAWNIQHAIPVRTKGNVIRWKEALKHYPESLPERIVRETAAFWRLPHRIEMLWTLAKRDNLLSLTEWLAADVEDCLRIVFAINRVWEPDWKNLTPALALLRIKPPRLDTRISKIYSDDDLFARVRQSLELVLEVLSCVPSEIDVSLAKENILESLEQNTTQ